MAARSGSGSGALISAFIFGLLTVALFVTTVIFFSQKGAAEKKLRINEESNREFVRDQERTQDAVQRIRAAAAKENQSVVGYLMETNGEAMNLSLGSKSATIEDLRGAFDTYKVPQAGNLAAFIRTQQQQIAQLEQANRAAEMARQSALDDKQAEVARVDAMQEGQQQTIASLNSEIATMRDEVDRYREELNGARAEMNTHVQDVENAFREREAALQAEIDRQQRDLLLANDTVRRLQSELRGQQVAGRSEEAMVDGRITGMDSTANDVFVNIGRKQKARLGMAFEVYADATAVRRDDETGEYPQGKATIEIISLDENSSTARVVRQSRGNPLAKGDVIVNAVYDPNKVYTFLVYGNFDTNGDGQYTEQEGSNIRARIESWGGDVIDELTGNVDFLVLGQRPALPPEPPINAPTAVIQRFMELKSAAQRYDELFDRAASTSIPVLTSNRLNTLTGNIEQR